MMEKETSKDLKEHQLDLIIDNFTEDLIYLTDNIMPAIVRVRYDRYYNAEWAIDPEYIKEDLYQWI